jgi:predicted nucleic-acid-binding protein
VYASIEAVTTRSNVTTDFGAVALGLAVLRAGGDFADGVISHAALGNSKAEFLTFDKKAARLLTKAGVNARLLA